MNKDKVHILHQDAISLLRSLIAIPSMSGAETQVSDYLQNYLQQKGMNPLRSGNNIWCSNKNYNDALPSILLNSHVDTVKPASGYTKDPYQPIMEGGKLFGLGSTDAGASLCCLLGAFEYFYDQPSLCYNIIFSATAEEEISGKNGVESLFSLPAFNNMFLHGGSFAIVGEPTQTQLAIAEKGLLVIDCVVFGKAGHAARNEGVNAIKKAIDAIQWFNAFRFERISPLLGEVHMNVTVIETENKLHNVVPASCHFVVDIRLNELYTHEEVLSIIRGAVDAEITPRSTRLRSSSIDPQHPVVQAGLKLGKQVYGSPTMSDQALIPLPSLKCGPGNSARSHTADEYIEISEMEAGLECYVQLLDELVTKSK
jgi:acetylornithine deacetylase